MGRTVTIDEIKKYAETYGMHLDEKTPIDLSWCLTLADKACAKGKADAIDEVCAELSRKLVVLDDSGLTKYNLLIFARRIKGYVEQLKEQKND